MMELLKLLMETIGSWLVAYLVCGIVHEGGHVVAGLVQGWRFEMLVIGPMKLYRDEKDDKVKVGIEKNIVLWGGIGGTTPREMSDDNIQKFAKVLIAGPVASIVIGAINSIFLILHPGIFTAMMTAVPMAMGVACLIPTLKTGILFTDGGRFLRIKRGGKTYAEEKAIFDAAMLRQFDASARYDEEGIEAMTSSDDAAIQYLGHYYAYLNAKADQDEEAMNERIASMKALEPKVPKTIHEMCDLNA
ncbi:MAG: hypothetical protein J6X14_06165 [Lachnospiraceae bacterium]|nr:hypothetical protein [Lachnospiraceae bacterium]MBP5669878.1 hypothetical protein [Lachnospiraceae bacterium]